MAHDQTAADMDAERAWFQGIDARRNGKRAQDNPFPVRGSRQWNCWAGAWAAEDHNMKVTNDAR